VTYGTFAPNHEGEPYPPIEVVRADFEQMRAAGFNTVRLYTPPSNRLADAAAEAGLYLIPDICWGPRRCELDSRGDVRFMREWLCEHAGRLAGHPAILMYSLGNEIPPLMVRWYGRRRVEAWLKELYDTAKDQAPQTLVTYVNHPPTEHLNLPFLDVCSWNVYLEREQNFRSYLGRLQMLAGDRPVFLAELGLDSRQHGEAAQAESLTWQVRAAFEKGLCGIAVYSWTDEWQIFGSRIDGWSFGLTDAGRRPKPALCAVQRAYTTAHSERRWRLLPKATVVVCAYNAAATIAECLRSLLRLNYPSYEIIVVDDGSSDPTAEIAERCGVRVIRSERGGLSRARNTGIAAALGSLVAFIDSDAYADQDWLFFMATTLEEQNASGVGGPNLTPPRDGFVARCVGRSPGNPTHVLLDNERAEHIPGCNMAFRKDALERIGGFDPTHRTAGDDVDVCWKLLASFEPIAFSPAAIVWHHRRPTVRSYLRQQRGYGYAEAHLHRRYPGHYNFFGHAVWQGGVYDGMRHAVSHTELPALFRSRIYQGRFGSAQFQSIYPSLRTHWFQLFTTVEWMVVMLCLAVSGFLTVIQSEIVGTILLSIAAVGWLGTASAAWVAGSHAASAERWQRFDWLRGVLLIGLLHLIQPMARWLGRLRGWLELCRQPHTYSSTQRLYGNLAQREKWLHRLESHLCRCGWIARPSCPFDRADLDILGPGPFSFQLQSVCEEELKNNQHYVRYRVLAKWKPKTLACFVLFVTSLVAVIATDLWPLLVPLGVFFFLVLRARWTLPRAISQLAVECGEGLGMTRVPEP
jgi:glycosyltransferase involved in cell wall biosynthesis